MNFKFEEGERVKIKNHPNKALIEREVTIRKRTHSDSGKDSDGNQIEAMNLYRVYLVSNGKGLGWAPEKDLEKFYSEAEK